MKLCLSAPPNPLLRTPLSAWRGRLYQAQRYPAQSAALATVYHRALRLFLLSLLFVCVAAHAGRSCEEKPRDVATVTKAMNLALKTRIALDNSGAQVAFLARAGQDLSKYGLRYSHMAVVWRDHPQGRWLVVHELNHCGSANSDLYDEGLGNFFLDDLFQYKALIVIPSAATQARLASVLASDVPQQLHLARYNMLAYPFSTQYQNSNQWVLELYATANQDKPDISDLRLHAQEWLKSAGYQPSTIELSAMTRLGARMFRANVAFDDQPFGRRMAGKIDTVTVDSVVRFVTQNEPDASQLVLREGDGRSFKDIDIAPRRIRPDPANSVGE